MTVEPGFGGQKFMNECLSKITEVRNLISKYELSDVYIEVDGGIDDTTSKLVIQAGANALVAGSYIYNSDDIKKAIESLRL